MILYWRAFHVYPGILEMILNDDTFTGKIDIYHDSTLVELPVIKRIATRSDLVIGYHWHSHSLYDEDRRDNDKYNGTQ